MLPITERFLDNYNRPNRNLKQLKGIIVHWTANLHKGANAIANRNYFNKKPSILNSKGKIVYASAHYVIDDLTIIQCLPDLEVGYHCGAKWSRYKDTAHHLMNSTQQNGDSPNNYTIGIEMCVNSDSDFSITRLNTIDLIRYLLNTYNLTTNDVFRHFDITGKDCPRMMIDNAIWQSFLAEIDGNTMPNNTLKINTAALNVRKGPGTNHQIVRQLFNGELATKIDQKGLWYQIGEHEWIHSHYVIST